MDLRRLAQTHLGVILEDKTKGFGWDITVIDPNGVTALLTGFSNDVSDLIDPDTGQAISGRVASVALRIAHLKLNNLGIPQGISNRLTKPWVVKFNDIGDEEHTFKVQQSNPDRALGIVTCLLEVYKEAP
jgi:hypothetical protein